MEVARGCEGMGEKEYSLGWQVLFPGAAKRIWHLIECFGSPGEAWRVSESRLIAVGGFTPAHARELVRRRELIRPAEELEKLFKMGIDFIDFGDPCYPEMLKNIFDPPLGIFVRGNLPIVEQQAVAIVGSRKPTPYGLAVAEKLGAGLAGAGVTVVSGMARGVDTAAHRGALGAGGRTIAVLGCGVDVVYPRENKKLMEEICHRGVVVSEFPPGSPPEAWHFPVRNRIISGLSRGVVVVEAAARSGALITADMALEQGRDVMAVPGNVSSPMSCGPNRLLKQGAKLVEGPDDILDELGINRLFNKSNYGRTAMPRLTAEEEAVMSVLNYDPASLDKVVERCGLSTQQVLAALMFLELKGLVRQFPGKNYASSGL